MEIRLVLVIHPSFIEFILIPSSFLPSELLDFRELLKLDSAGGRIIAQLDRFSQLLHFVRRIYLRTFLSYLRLSDRHLEVDSRYFEIAGSGHPFFLPSLSI